jgi:hypothetical protein
LRPQPFRLPFWLPAELLGSTESLTKLSPKSPLAGKPLPFSVVSKVPLPVSRYRLPAESAARAVPPC